MWEDAQYVCPKCGHFNVSARAKKQGVTSPLSPSQPPLSPPPAAASASSPNKIQIDPAAQDPLPSLVSALSQPAGVRETSPSRSTAKSVAAEKDTPDLEGVVAKGGYEAADGGSMRMEIDT